MAYTSIEFPRFDGLDLRTDPQQVGMAAIDCKDVLVDQPGRVHQRPGYKAWGPSIPSSSTPLVAKSMYVGSTPAMQLVVLTNSSTGKLQYTSFSQAAVASSFSRAATAGADAWLAAVGDPSNNRVFYSTTGFADIYYDTAGVVSGVGGGPLAVSPVDNRLMSAVGSKVYFSNPGDPLTFPANNYEEFTPGDGETIKEMVAWGNNVLIFKQTKFFVCYGFSVDGSGNAVLNYHSEVRGQGIPDAHGAVATDEGVYFANDAGVWLTGGGGLERVSVQLDPWFRGDTLPYLGNYDFIGSRSYLRLASARGYLFLMTGTGVIAYDRQNKAWLPFTIGAIVGDGFNSTNPRPVPDSAEQLFFFRANNQQPQYWPSELDKDATFNTVLGYWRSGFWSPGQPGAETTIREWLIDGVGTIETRVMCNDAATLTTAATVTLGTSPTIDQGRDRRAVRGRNFSLMIRQGGSTAWSVSRVTANLRGQRSAGLKAT